MKIDVLTHNGPAYSCLNDKKFFILLALIALMGSECIDSFLEVVKAVPKEKNFDKTEVGGRKVEEQVESHG